MFQSLPFCLNASVKMSPTTYFATAYVSSFREHHELNYLTNESHTCSVKRRCPRSSLSFTRISQDLLESESLVLKTIFLLFAYFQSIDFSRLLALLCFTFLSHWQNFILKILFSPEQWQTWLCLFYSLEHSRTTGSELNTVRFFNNFLQKLLLHLDIILSFVSFRIRFVVR